MKGCFIPAWVSAGRRCGKRPSHVWLHQDTAMVLALMPALGQKRTKRHFGMMSALPAKADIRGAKGDVR
jgi:hypothetical protein